MLKKILAIVYEGHTVEWMIIYKNTDGFWVQDGSERPLSPGWILRRFELPDSRVESNQKASNLLLNEIGRY